MRTAQLFAGSIFMVLAGCSNMDVVIQRQAEMDRRLESLVQANSSLNMRINEISGELNQIRESRKSDREELASIKSSQSTLRAMIADQVASQGEPSPANLQKIEVVNREATVREHGEGGPPESYVKAFGLFSANNYREAIAAFEEFIRINPSNEYAGNARYWIGECYYTQKDYPLALVSFQNVIDKYPNGNKVADAMLKVAFSHISMNEPDKAKLVLESLVRKFPKSPAAAKARERLNRH